MRTRLTSWKHVADLSSLGLNYTLSLSVVIAVDVSEKNISTLLLIPTKYFTRGPVIRTRVAGVPSQWHNPWNWKCAFINFLKVGMQFVFLICHHLFRVDLPKGITTTLRNWPLARNEDGWKQLTYLIFPWIPLINMLLLPPSMKVPSRFWQLLPWHLDLYPEIHASSCIIYLVFLY